MTRLTRDLEFAAIDFETTGLDADLGDRVVEVAVVRGRLDQTPAEWSTLVDPERPIGATSVHGITADMLAGKPTFGAILPELLARLEGAVLVAHNADFDLSFLRMECARAGVPMPAPPVLCSLGMARRVLALGDHRLTSLVARFGIPCGAAHRATDDARASWILARMMLRQSGSETGLTLGDAIGLSKRRQASESDRLYRALERAQKSGLPLTVEYLSPHREAGAVRRDITVKQLTRRQVVAFCHLRNAGRTFRLDRLRIVEP